MNQAPEERAGKRTGERTADRREFLRRVGAWTVGIAATACRAPAPAVSADFVPPRGGPGSVRPGSDPYRPEEPEPAPGTASSAEAAEPTAAALLPVPDLADARVAQTLAGLRPYRRRSVRLELGELDGRAVVHDYGHGGAGITLSFGCAEEVVELARGVVRPPAEACVLGAGICGLTAALRLAEAGYAVRVLARDFPPDTTSDVAGGQFAPSLVARGDTRLLERLVRRSHASFAALAGAEFGIHARPNYATRGRGHALTLLPRDLAPREPLDALPFPGPRRPGFVVHTLLIEPPVFLPRLVDELRARGVALERRDFEHLDDVRAVRADLLVDCLGLGAGTLFDDPLVRAVRGQLVHLDAQDLPYLLSHAGYLFPRRDAVVLGGTVERGSRDTAPDPADCRRILETHRRFFAAEP